MEASASGMATQQRVLELVSENLASADVVGFKGAAAHFAAVAGGGATETGLAHVFTQGKLERSGGPFDVALDGPGFFVVARDGRTAYTRAGSFTRAADGSLRNDEGWRLPGIRIPATALSVDVAADGRITARDAGGVRRTLGRLPLARFAAPEALRAVGSALFAPTDASGRAQRLAPGTAAETKVAFGTLERSNVTVVDAMMQILTAQRAYEADAKGVQAADEMRRIANNLQR